MEIERQRETERERQSERECDRAGGVHATHTHPHTQCAASLATTHTATASATHTGGVPLTQRRRTALALSVAWLRTHTAHTAATLPRGALSLRTASLGVCGQHNALSQGALAVDLSLLGAHSTASHIASLAMHCEREMCGAGESGVCRTERETSRAGVCVGCVAQRRPHTQPPPPPHTPHTQQPSCARTIITQHTQRVHTRARACGAQ